MLCMARAKKASDAVYNERRRLKRAYARQIKALEKSGASTSKVNKLKKQAQKAIDATYQKNISQNMEKSVPRETLRQQQMKNIKSGFTRLATGEKTKEQKKSIKQQNALFALKMRNNMTTDNPLVSKSLTQGFLIATRDMWQGKKDRYKAILENFPGKTLEEVYYQYIERMKEINGMGEDQDLGYGEDQDLGYGGWDDILGGSGPDTYEVMKTAVLVFR